jgi:hypothetical protein
MKKLSLFASVSAALVCAAVPASFGWSPANVTLFSVDTAEARVGLPLGAIPVTKGPMMPQHRSCPCIINIVDEIADNFGLIEIIVRDLHAGELIFDQYHQFKTIEPVGSEIVTEMRFICDTPDIDIQMLSNERAHLANIKALFPIRCLLSQAQATEGHDDAPGLFGRQTSKQSVPQHGAAQKF